MLPGRSSGAKLLPVFSGRPNQIRKKSETGHRKTGKPRRSNSIVAVEPNAPIPPPDCHGTKQSEDLPDLDIGFQVMAKLPFGFAERFRVADHLNSHVRRN
jgi:hypothetical protein